VEVDDQLPAEGSREVQVRVSVDQNSLQLGEGKKSGKAAGGEEEHRRGACIAERVDRRDLEECYLEQE